MGVLTHLGLTVDSAGCFCGSFAGDYYAVFYPNLPLRIISNNFRVCGGFVSSWNFLSKSMTCLPVRIQVAGWLKIMRSAFRVNVNITNDRDSNGGFRVCN